MHARIIFFPLAVVLLCSVCLSAADTPPAKPVEQKVVPFSVQPAAILKMDTSFYWSAITESGTIWRYHETWQTDVVRNPGGDLVGVDPFDYTTWKCKGGRPPITAAKKIEGSPLPPEGWQKPDFDDSTWVQHSRPVRAKYRALSLVCMRGEFEVTDPAKVSDLSLQMDFQGGVVVYVNGLEVARAFMPDGKITAETLATEYPQEAYEGPDGKPIDVPADLALAQLKGNERLLKRWRKMTATVPASALRKGVNVLAIEAHRAPAHPMMFTNPGQRPGTWEWMRFWWNRVVVEDVQLCAAASATGIKPNFERPKGLQVWNATQFQTIVPKNWGVPSLVKPIKLSGLKNGAYSSQFVVSCEQPIRGLGVLVTDLKSAGGGTIPASAVSIGYAGTWDALDPATPKEVPIVDGSWNGKSCQKALLGAVQPVWLTVNVPKTASNGQYAGRVTVTTESGKLAEIPLRLDVIGNYVLPDPNQFRFYLGVLESPDSLAMQYQVPMWSEAHWTLIDRAFQALALVGAKEIHTAAIAETELGNSNSMYRWIKQADGSYKVDSSIVEKYLDTAIKHLGKVPVVVLTVMDTSGKYMATELSPATGALANFDAPKWGTPEAQAFWKPVAAGLQQSLAKRGMEKALYLGYSCNGGFDKGLLADFKVLAPKAKWMNVSHFPTFPEVGVYASVEDNTPGVYWDPEVDKPRYGWTSEAPLITVGAVRGKCGPQMMTWSTLSQYRLCAEGMYLACTWSDKVTGIGHIGGDFWPVLKDANGNNAKSLNERYSGWGSLTFSQTILHLLGAGKDGPAPTPRLRMMQESIQESEVRIFVQNALLDETKKARLGPDLAKRANDLCHDRTRTLRYCSAYFGDGGADYGRVMNASEWQVESEQLYAMADEVQKALGK